MNGKETESRLNQALNYWDRNRILFGEQPEEEQEETGEQVREHPGGRRLAIRRVIEETMGPGFTDTSAIIFGQTENSSTRSSRSSTRNNGRFTAKKAYPFEIDPCELAEFEKIPPLSPTEIKEHREALGLSQGALAASLNLKRWHVSYTENGRAGLRSFKILTHGIRLLESHPELIQRKSGPV